MIAFGLSALLLSGCTTQIVGTGQPAEGATDPIALDGEVEDILLSDDELVDALDSSFERDAEYEPNSGDLDVMPDGIRTESQYTPIECLGVTSPGMRVVYEDAGVVSFAENNNYMAPISVIALESREAARDLFDDFVSQWEDCDGTFSTLLVPDSDGADLGYDISDVDENDDMLTAMFKFGSTPHGATTTYTSRALSFRQNVIVDVEVHGEVPADEAVPDNEAVALAEIMLDKISDLTYSG